MSKNLAIIDLDSMLYQSTGADSIELCFEKFREKLNNCLVKTNADYWCGFVGKGKTFRHDIDPLYKSNRTQKPPKYLATIKEWAIEEFNLNVCINAEADDYVAYWMNNNIYYNPKYTEYEPFEINVSDSISKESKRPDSVLLNKILCAIDKDVLNSIPSVGNGHFNYSYKIKEESKSKDKTLLTEDDFNKGWWVETTLEESNINFWKSMITGDSTDNIVGIHGRGKVYADKLLEKVNHPSVQNIIASEYQLKYGQSQGIYEFQKNYRLLHILNSDEDFIREVGVLPEFPKINKVEKQVYEEQIIEF